MGVRRVEDFGAWEFAVEFKLEVYTLIERSKKAQRAFKYRDQLEDAASGIERAMSEGFARGTPAEFAQFLRYALASLAESVTCLRDGIQRGYFAEEDCLAAFAWALRCKSAMLGLHASQLREVAKRRERRLGSGKTGQDLRNTGDKSREVRGDKSREVRGDTIREVRGDKT